jgi:hypothetical protein
MFRPLDAQRLLFCHALKYASHPPNCINRGRFPSVLTDFNVGFVSRAHGKTIIAQPPQELNQFAVVLAWCRLAIGDGNEANFPNLLCFDTCSAGIAG